MDRKDSIKEKEIKRSTNDQIRKRNPSNKISIKEKRLPWWVELLFVQIGLPDKLLIKILKRYIFSSLYKNQVYFSSFLKF